MTINRITINGQEYNSPDEMPPDVRRLYDNAMQAMGNALPGGQAGNTTVFTSRGGLLNTNIVVRKNITVNDKHYKSLDEMPPELRQLAENAMQQAQGTTGGPAITNRLSMSTDPGTPQVRAFVSTSPTTPTQAYVPIGSGPNAQINARRFLRGVIFWVGVGLAFWIYLGFRK
jgi:hypothetical protein